MMKIALSIIIGSFIMVTMNVQMVVAQDLPTDVDTSELEGLEKSEIPTDSDDSDDEAIGVSIDPNDASALENAEPSVVKKYISGVLEKLFLQIQNKGPKFACRKASFFDFRFSIRSGKGILCKIKEVAAVAELVCGKYLADENDENDADYENSQCHYNALDALGLDAAGNLNAPEKVLAAGIIKLGVTAKNILCLLSPGVPYVGPALKVACALSNVL